MGSKVVGIVAIHESPLWRNAARTAKVCSWRISEVPSALGDFRTSLQSGLSALMAGASNEFTP